MKEKERGKDEGKEILETLEISWYLAEILIIEKIKNFHGEDKCIKDEYL